jgi:hypothetical protein
MKIPKFFRYNVKIIPFVENTKNNQLAEINNNKQTEETTIKIIKNKSSICYLFDKPLFLFNKQ